MSDREALAALIWAGVMKYERQPESCYIEPEDRLKIADAILAAGWQAPPRPPAKPDGHLPDGRAWYW